MFELDDDRSDLRALSHGDPQMIKLRPSNHAVVPRQLPDFGRTALVIGANGFVGSHLTRMLLDRPQWDRVVCLVRDRKNLSARTRLWRALSRIDDIDPDHFSQRIECVTGSYTELGFGCSEPVYRELQSSADAVFHVAGTTAYEPSYEQLRQSYVVSTLRLLDFCSRDKVKQLHYLSSVSIYLFQSPADFDKYSWWHSGYARMKWVNGAIIAAAVSDHGVQASTYHAPYIVGSIHTGIDPSMSYSFWQMVVECARVGVIWRGNFFQFVPVDLLCETILANAEQKSLQPIVHPTLAPLGTGEIAPLIGCTIIPAEQFFQSSGNWLSETLQRFNHNASYRDLERVCRAGELDQFMDQNRIPIPRTVFERGLAQPIIQRALRRARLDSSKWSLFR